MLYICDAKLDVTENIENFLDFGGKLYYLKKAKLISASLALCSPEKLNGAAPHLIYVWSYRLLMSPNE